MFLNFSISALSSVSCCVFSASKDLFPQIHEVLLTDFDVRFLPRRRAESYESLILSNPIFSEVWCQRNSVKYVARTCLRWKKEGCTVEGGSRENHRRGLRYSRMRACFPPSIDASSARVWRARSRFGPAATPRAASDSGFANSTAIEISPR